MMQLFELHSIIPIRLFILSLMGGCMGVTQGRLRGKDNFDIEPSDTLTLDPSSFPTLSFKALLTKLKLKWCARYKFISIRINFGKYQQFELKSKFITNETAKWDIYHDFDFKASEYDLRKEFMLLSFFNQDNHLLGTLKINLYLLSTGPYHQDFSVPLQKAENARISFNLKIAQEILIKLKVNEAEMIPKDKEFPGDLFSFGLNSIMGDRVDESAISYKFLVAFKEGEFEEMTKRGVSRRLDRKQTMGQRVTIENNLNLRKALSKDDFYAQQKQEEMNGDSKGQVNKIEWSSKKSKEMPSLQLTVPLFDLHGATFSIIFYTYRNKMRQFSSECFLSYNKFASFQPIYKVDPITKKVFQQREIKIQTKTWNHGKETGKAKFNITFTLQKHIKQLQLCVRTERGILESSPVFGESGGSSKIPEELVELEKVGNEIQNQFIEVSKSVTKTQNNKWVLQVNKRLIRMQEILVSSSKQSKLMFIYQDENALLKGQRGLIEIGKRIRSLLDQDKQEIAENCWQLLIDLIKRGELSLHYMGFTKNQREECLSGSPSEYLTRKKEVALSYHILLVDLLQRTLKSLQAYNYQSQRQFAQLFCAYAYFRLPKFRNEILTAISRNNDPEIEEWRGTQYSLGERMESADRETAFKLMFDWQNNFYNVIENQEDYSKTEAKLLQLMRTNDWEIRMKKRGGAFFAFVRYWVSYVESVVVNSKHVSWRYFPGYNKILLGFLAEMKLRELQQYSEAMKKAAASLLSNQKLLNPFVLIVFRKTNENDQLNVVRAFDLVSIFIQSISNRGRSLPSSFDFKLLTKAIREILEGSAAFAIGKVLLVIYDNFLAFPVEFRIDISNYLLTRVFFHLFLHWSFNVRTIFHHLLFIRIFHENDKPLNQLDFKDQEVFRYALKYRTELVSRYKKLMLILENAQQFEHKIRQRKIHSFDQELYKKLKKKVQQKFKGKRNPQLKLQQQFQTRQQYHRQLMLQLAQPKLQRYNSEVMSRALKVVVENRKQTPLKEEVIVRMGTNRKLSEGEDFVRTQRKLNVAEIDFDRQLQALKEDEIPYVRLALQEYNKINEMFIKNLERNKQSVPVVKLELALDEKQMRPDGISEHQDW